MDATRPGGDLLTELPDLPRWLHARALLLSRRGHVVQAGDGCRMVCSRTDRLAVPVTIELSAEIDACVQREAPGALLLLQDVMLPAARYHLPDWDAEPVALYAIDPARARQWTLPPWPTAPLTPEQIESADGVPAPLRDELIAAAARSPIWAASLDGRPASFAWTPLATEGWFDVSVRTLDDARGRGLGRAAVMGLVVDRLLRGLRPVLRAPATSEAAHRLARGLGFDQVDQLWAARRA